MNINELSFDVFYIPHSKLWSAKVGHKGVRLAAPFLIECGQTLEEALEKIKMFANHMNNEKPLGEAISNYVAHNPSGE